MAIVDWWAEIPIPYLRYRQLSVCWVLGTWAILSMSFQEWVKQVLHNGFTGFSRGNPNKNRAHVFRVELCGVEAGVSVSRRAGCSSSGWVETFSAEAVELGAAKGRVSGGRPL